MSLFEELQTDPLLGTEVMEQLGVHPDHLIDPVTVEKLKDVLEYVSKVPERSFFINRAIAGKDVNKLDHMFGLIQLHRKRDGLEQQMAQIDEEIGFYNK